MVHLENAQREKSTESTESTVQEQVEAGPATTHVAALNRFGAAANVGTECNMSRASLKPRLLDEFTLLVPDKGDVTKPFHVEKVQVKSGSNPDLNRLTAFAYASRPWI